MHEWAQEEIIRIKNYTVYGEVILKSLAFLVKLFYYVHLDYIKISEL